MATLKPLDYTFDYYREKPGLFELPREAAGLAEDSFEIKPITRISRALMLKHERVILEGLESFVAGEWEKTAHDMAVALATMPALHDARVLAALSHYLLGRPRRALEIAIPGIRHPSSPTMMGRCFKAWLPSLRVLVRLDDDLAASFYPNRLGMCALAIAAHRELDELRQAGLLLEQTANEYGLLDEFAYVAVYLHIKFGNYKDAWRLMKSREYHCRDSLDVGIAMLRAESAMSTMGTDWALSEYRAAFLFQKGVNPWLRMRGLYRMAQLYREGGYLADERETLLAIDEAYLPEHVREEVKKRIAELPVSKTDDEGLVLDKELMKRFDYVWRGKVAPDELVDFLET